MCLETISNDFFLDDHNHYFWFTSWQNQTKLKQNPDDYNAVYDMYP